MQENKITKQNQKAYVNKVRSLINKKKSETRVRKFWSRGTE
jgi:hypothetical protein